MTSSCANYFDQVLWLLEKNVTFLLLPTFELSSIFFSVHVLQLIFLPTYYIMNDHEYLHGPREKFGGFRPWLVFTVHIIVF